MNVSIPHQTQRIDFASARDGDGSAWSRASEAEVRDVTKRDRTGGFEVSIDDGDEHDVVLIEDVDGMLGYCDCDGFAYHGTADRLAGNACAHLCLVRQMAVLDDSLIPSATTRFDVEGEPTEDDGTETIDADVVDHSKADEDESAEITVEDDPSDDASPTVKTPETTVDNPFADELEDVDARFVMDLGGEPYIRRRGFQRLARSEGFFVVTEMVTYQSDTDNELAEARARVLEDGDVVATGTGTAHLPSEDMDGAAGNLNELAETRALSRAMGWATGAGLSAVEVDAAAEYDGDDVEHVATDGGQR